MDSCVNKAFNIIIEDILSNLSMIKPNNEDQAKSIILKKDVNNIDKKSNCC